MAKKTLLATMVCALTISVWAAESDAPKWSIPANNFFFGLGGGYNSVKLDQYLDPLVGTSDVYQGTTLVSSGTAQGPAAPFHSTNSTFAPEAQIGYFHRFMPTSLVLGAKFFYKYLGVTAYNQNVIAPQAGVNTSTGSNPTQSPFLGNAVIGSDQVSINHELDLVVFLGYAWDNGFFYIGGGPSVFESQTDLYNVVGYANINGNSVNVSGAAQNFSSYNWSWGGIGQIGVGYYFIPTWFVDVNYTYAATPRYSTNYSSTFSNPEPNGQTTSGTLSGTSSQAYTSQAVMVTLNKAFSF